MSAYGRSAYGSRAVLATGKQAIQPRVRQVPDNFELIINLKAAKSIGIKISPMLLARANEVIE
jgi:ABC-type uncharacterized transport system substrate-binding protein